MLIHSLTYELHGFPRLEYNLKVASDFFERLRKTGIETDHSMPLEAEDHVTILVVGEITSSNLRLISKKRGKYIRLITLFALGTTFEISHRNILYRTITCTFKINMSIVHTCQKFESKAFPISISKIEKVPRSIQGEK